MPLIPSLFGCSPLSGYHVEILTNNFVEKILEWPPLAEKGKLVGARFRRHLFSRRAFMITGTAASGMTVASLIRISNSSCVNFWICRDSSELAAMVLNLPRKFWTRLLNASGYPSCWTLVCICIHRIRGGKTKVRQRFTIALWKVLNQMCWMWPESDD